ncbi:hypothetical protein DYU11_29680 [Fibrisoma montanum]|uniref:Ppx/GppA phosphatase domain-containing protein n=1 Tax=Fibrisoma montanum TaxID=2305895 RepID=A0A418LY58_9BACT|nr:hypothetical protein [Fibrisoma montanum]RIV18128.1 hypothetical protein DYU11_29680 [Fibrisoma montanum]
MPHILRIDNDPNVIEQNHQGWTASSTGLVGNRIEHIPDTMLNQAGMASKSGTSIPSPFARLYLFDAAFRLVMNNLRPAQPTMYHVLVSHCLDLLELLFQGGNSPDIAYRIWNRADRLSSLTAKAPLASSPNRRHPHAVLAKALELDMRHDLADLQNLTLIYYKGALLGGTSPLTLVFTSPNWEQERQNKFLDPPKSSTGRTLFQNEYVPLENRDRTFVTYLSRLFDEYKGRLPQNSGLTLFLDKLFRDNPYPLPIDAGRTLDDFDAIRTGIEGASTLQVIGGLPLYAVRADDVLEEIERDSDFVMIPTVQHFRGETRPNGVRTDVRTPLALASRMDVRGRYVKNTDWDPRTVIPAASLNDLSGGGLLADRRLPGVDNVQYPFVTTDDFLEDFLIRVPYKINNERFFTGTLNRADCDFLLPVRKEYFNFFTLEDLRDNLTLDVQETSVVATLRIPVRGSNIRYVEFRRTYDLSKTETAYKLPVGMGFFPFYRMIRPEQQAVNQYTVLVADGSTSQATTVGFFRYADVVGRQALPVARPTPRSPKDGERPASYFYKVQQAFDLVELKLTYEGIPYRGLVLPQFTLVGDNNYREFTFAVDFGTSNTHVAYSVRDEGAEPDALTVTDADLQTVLLNKPYKDANLPNVYSSYHRPISFGEMEQMEPLLRREFVPSLIGRESRLGTPFAFPLRTTVYEREGLTEGGDYLFSKLNLGFNIDLEQGRPDGNRYQTNLKWLFENRPHDTLNDLRVRTFFETLLLLIRHKVLMNKGDVAKTRIVWVAPSSMSRRTRNRLTAEWQQAARNVFGTDQNFESTPILESLAPYFYLQQQNAILSTADAVNVDIGGGTSDIMVFAKGQDRYFNTSFRFAANDIWGGGLDETGSPSATRKDNGFLTTFMAFRRNNPSSRATEADQTLDAFMDPARNMTAEDVISLLFKYDSHFQFTKSIQNQQPALQVVLYLHYAAIIYHLVQLIENQSKQDPTARPLSLPRFLTFTGRGSQYLNLLGTRNDLVDYTRLLFEAYSDLPVPGNFEILMTPNPKETTANGAVRYQNAPDRNAYRNNEPTAYWGTEPDGTAAFVYNQTRAGDVTQQAGFHESVLRNVQTFLEKTLKNPAITGFLREFEIQRPEEYYQFLTGPDLMHSRLYDSYMLAKMSLERSPDQLLSETFFFLPLKHALYELSKHIAQA